MYGLPVGAFGRTQSAFEKLIHPDDRANVVRLVDYALKSGEPTEAEWRVVWSDRSVHWIVGRWQVFVNESGQAMRLIGVNVDVTRRKQAEEALWAANRKLIEAQEQERARIGRELHDDINQRLAMLALELEELPRKSCGGWEPRASTTEKDGGDFGRRASPVTRVALFRTGISRCRSGFEKLVRGICQAAKIGDRLHR